MAYDLEEQEQLATLKDWWSKYGNMTTWILIAGLSAYSGWTGWNYYQRTQAAEASALYDEMQAAIGAKDKAKTLRAAGDITTRYARTLYAQMGALAAAKTAFEANDLAAAKTQLQWVIDHGNDEYKAVAKLRLSGVLLDEKAFDAALKMLDGEFLPQFKGAIAERKGDILAAQNKTEAARAAYKAALEASDKKNPGRQLIQLKLESVGGSVPEEKAAA